MVYHQEPYHETHQEKIVLQETTNLFQHFSYKQ
jgi:hypothetical protein